MVHGFKVRISLSTPPLFFFYHLPFIFDHVYVLSGEKIQGCLLACWSTHLVFKSGNGPTGKKETDQCSEDYNIK